MDEDWTGVIFGVSVLVLGTMIIVVVLILAGSFAKARIARREEEKYEELVQRYEQLVTQTREKQEAVAADTSDVRRRLIEVERILREVE